MSWITDRLPWGNKADDNGDVLVPLSNSGERSINCRDAVDLTRRLCDGLAKAHAANVPPPTREELVQELLDAVDAFNEMDGSCEWTDVMDARENLE